MPKEKPTVSSGLNSNGGEGGIRTLDTVLSVYPLSRRFPLFLMANDSSIHIKMTHLFWK